jgi:DNA processing protein
MTKAILFKVLQRRLKFRNPNHWVDIPAEIEFSASETEAAASYIKSLRQQNINYTFPGDPCYPEAFYKMKEPPLFLEYQGAAFWMKTNFVAVVGSREFSPLTQQWMKTHLPSFIEGLSIGIVSGGARGVDQWAHLLSVKSNQPTVIVLPAGLQELYPSNLSDFAQPSVTNQVCFLSEFEKHQKIHKSHFYFRNRLIAALGQITLVTQSSLKSGSLLTVHHCLENGKPVAVVPAHPELMGFDGNLKLLKEGAFPVQNNQDLLDFWNAEFQSK